VPLHHLSVYQISRQLDNLFLHYGNFHTLTKRRKNEETKAIFEGSYLRNTLSWNLKCGVLMMEGISTAKIVQLCTSSTKLHIRENCVTVLPVNILMGVVRYLLGPHDTLLRALIPIIRVFGWVIYTACFLICSMPSGTKFMQWVSPIAKKAGGTILKCDDEMRNCVMWTFLVAMALILL